MNLTVPSIRQMITCVSLLAALASPQPAAAQTSSTAELKEAFANPPADTRPGCYWYWINDNISKEGITKDLEAMARVGIGRAYIGHIFNMETPTDTPPGDVKFMTDEWWDAVQWAVKEADRCGIDIGFFNTAGWSQSGAPWVKPHESMRYLGHSETTITGGKTVDTILPVPPIETYPNTGGSKPKRTGPNFTSEDFQDVRVIAFRNDGHTSVPMNKVEFATGLTEAGKLFDGSEETFANFQSNRPTTLTLTLPEETTAPVQNVIIKPLDHSYTFVCTVEASEDGKSYRELTRYEEQRGHQGPKIHSEIVVPFPPSGSKHLRITMDFQGGDPNRKIRVAEVSLGEPALLGGYVRKQLAETSPAVRAPWDAYTWDTQPQPGAGSSVSSDKVIDLSSKMDSDGRLKWEAPAGKWTIYRMGMIPIGTQSAPTSDESRGLEVDKLNRTHLTNLFNGMVGEFIKRTPEEDRRALKYVIADSYETGPQNWTDQFIEKFEKKFGYSPVKYLPTIAGKVVDSPDISDRFLWDMRNLITESVAYEYVGGLRELCNQNGLKLWLENYGHWGFIAEFLLYGSQSDEVGGEYWESADPFDNVECRAAASSAHIYGKTDVYAEGFTSSRNFQQTPSTLKKWCDWSFGAGINHQILHVYIHQPDEKKPGIIQWFGTAFNRHNTWFEQSKAFIDYMRRGAVLLKTGQPVADVAYYIGENAPNMQGPMDPELPVGYDFDDLNSDVLLNHASVKDGKLVLKSGVSYSVLVLPKLKTMRPEVAAAIQRLVKAGAVVMGPKPKSSPSLQNYPECDEQLKAITDEIWGDVNGAEVKQRQYGDGWIYDGLPLTEVLQKHGVQPDIVLPQGSNVKYTVAGAGKLGVGATGGLLFKHRSAPDMDIYFLSNTSDAEADTTVSFRQDNRAPQFWDAVTGRVTNVPAYSRNNGRTDIPIKLESSESIYVTFGDAANADGDATTNNPKREQVLDLSSNWTVDFTNDRAPKGVAFEKLTDWLEHENPAIKSFSGTATYKKNFELKDVSDKRLILSLGNVKELATVRVNGAEVGTVWTNPWEIDVTDYVKQGSNTLELQVTNTWNNRLVADSKLPESEKQSYVSQTYQPNKNHLLMESGLMGPVILQEEVSGRLAD